jgi:6,7-dimethyl-8-ribityllumazine synthase
MMRLAGKPKKSKNLHMYDNSPRLLIIDARFYEDVSDELVSGAIAELEGMGATHSRVSVPGVFEIPAGIRHILVRDIHMSYDGYIALGCVIKGETDHYEHVSREGIRGLNDLAMEYSIAVGMGILTCDTKEQAMERASVDKGNVGARAARTAVQMVEFKRSLRLSE